MIKTPFKLLRIDHPLIPLSFSIEASQSWKGEEFLAWLRGEDASSLAVVDITMGMNYDLVCSLSDPVKGIIDEDPFEIVCKDTSVIYNSKASLRRRFQLIDDYLSDFPEEESITIPYSSRELATVAEGGRLVECYECLSYLNPKDSLAYFEYSTIGMDPSVLVSLHSRLTEKHKSDIMESRRIYAGTYPYPLPQEGFGLGTLAHILDYHLDDVSLKTLFSNCPSYLVFTMSDSSEKMNLILNANFHRGEYCPSIEYNQISEMINALIMRVSSMDYEGSRKAIRRMLAIAGLRHPLFGNEKDTMCSPYGINHSVFSKMTGGIATEAVAKLISARLDVDEGETLRILEEIKPK